MSVSLLLDVWSRALALRETFRHSGVYVAAMAVLATLQSQSSAALTCRAETEPDRRR